MELLNLDAPGVSSAYTTTGSLVWTITGDLKHGTVSFEIDIGGGYATIGVVLNDTIKAGGFTLPSGISFRARLSGNVGSVQVYIKDL